MTGIKFMLVHGLCAERKSRQRLAADRLPALKRLIAYTETWLIEFHPAGYWSAERREGTAVRYVCGDTTAELADRIDAAEARP